MLRFVSIRFERRLAEALSVISCTTPTPAYLYCDNADEPQFANSSVDDRLERLNATRFTTTSYDDEQPARPSDVGGSDLELQITARKPSDRSSTETVDAVLVDFGFFWVVFLLLDMLLVARRIGNLFRTESMILLL